MDRHTLQHELDPVAHARLDARPIRRPAAPVVELALDLQRRAGNRSVAAMVDAAQPAPVRRPATARGPETALAALAASVSARTTAGAQPAPHVQREPCTDCPDAAPAAMPEPELAADGNDQIG